LHGEVVFPGWDDGLVFVPGQNVARRDA
jgi:hypothetical protein